LISELNHFTGLIIISISPISPFRDLIIKFFIIAFKLISLFDTARFTFLVPFGLPLGIPFPPGLKHRSAISI